MGCLKEYAILTLAFFFIIIVQNVPKFHVILIYIYIYNAFFSMTSVFFSFYP
jgi:hypothetical protein